MQKKLGSFWDWIKRNSRFIMLILFYISFLVFIFYAINSTQINDTLLGVIIALLFPVFATFVNHLLKQDMEQRQQQREEVAAKQVEERKRTAELRSAYENMIEALAFSWAYHLDRNEYEAQLHQAFFGLFLFLPDRKELPSYPEAFAESFNEFEKQFNLRFERTLGAEEGFSIKDTFEAIHGLYKADPRLHEK